MYRIEVSETFRKQYKRLDKGFQKRVLEALRSLESDPYSPRSGADIIRVKGTYPQKYRLRVGDYRIIYMVDNDSIKVIETFSRGRDYRHQ